MTFALTLIVGSLGLAGASGSTKPFAACEAQFAAQPRSRAPADCIYRVAEKQRLWDEGARLLDSLRSRQPDNHWLEYELAGIEWQRESERAAEIYRAAAAGFAQQGDHRGEVLTRFDLRNFLQFRGRLEEAEEEVERTQRVAEASGDPELVARALVLKARHLRQKGEDVGRSYRLLLRAEQLVFPSGLARVQLMVIRELANVTFVMGRYDEALTFYRRTAVLSREERDPIGESSARYNIANTRLSALEELPREGGLEEVLTLAREALESALAADNRSTEATIRQTLGMLLSSNAGSRTEARRQLELCIEIAKDLKQPAKVGQCLWALGGHLADYAPREANRAIDEALALALEARNNRAIAYAIGQRMAVRWKTGPRQKAIADSLEALAAIEALRDLQQDPSGSTGVFSAWTKEYYSLAGHLLDDPTGAFPRADVELAFSVAERLRSRVLLEKVTRARNAPTLPSSHPLMKRRQEVLEAIVDLHRQFLDPRLSPKARGEALRKLERLEADETELREELARLDAELPKPRFTTLTQIESALSQDEALLSFQVALWKDIYGEFGGGAWLLLSTRGGTRVFRLPDRVKLEPAVPILVGLLERRDGSENQAVVRLYRDLLQEAVASLPHGIEKLVIIPDGTLHRMPFGALRALEADEPLAGRYEISIAPSATLWLRWRTSAPALGRRPALALADPVLNLSLRDGEAEEERAWDLAPGMRLGALPHAREEGRSMRRYMGGASRYLAGRDASEKFVKDLNLTEYGVLHFAAHAVVDEEHPDRSAILLAPGGDDQDGLLQFREIVDLNLDGALVVLSACRTASGAVVRGEGVLGLARAFFEAGARTVVGSLWPIRDDDTASLFESFYRHLGTGLSVAGALREAQREAIRAGMPASAWAGLIVLGDGNLVPLPGGRVKEPFSLTPFLVAGVVLAGVGLFALRSRRRREGS